MKDLILYDGALQPCLDLTTSLFCVVHGVQWASLPNGPSEVSSAGLLAGLLVLCLLSAAAAATVLLLGMVTSHLNCSHVQSSCRLMLICASHAVLLLLLLSVLAEPILMWTFYWTTAGALAAAAQQQQQGSSNTLQEQQGSQGSFNITAAAVVHTHGRQDAACQLQCSAPGGASTDVPINLRKRRILQLPSMLLLPFQASAYCSGT